MAPETSDRATRFRGEGRPKRRLSPSPPPAKSPAAKTPAAKKPPPKPKEASGSSSKKGTSAKKKARTPTPEEESEEETLPVDLKAKQSLPTLKDRQPEELSLRTYKSVSESGVLHAALDKSRQRWLMDGLFEKFWVKYSRKNKDEPAPSSQSMTKLNGECYMVIEPHSFKITLFSVKAPPSSSQTNTTSGTPNTPLGANVPPPTSLPPTPASFTQAEKAVVPEATPPIAQPAESAPQKGGNADKAPTPAQSALAEKSAAPPQSALSEKAAAPGPAAASEEAAAAPEKATAVKKEEAEKAAPSSSHPPVKNTPAPVTATASSQATRPDNANNADPVIQMLAARASTDDELKALMKIVAQGKATQDQLSVFQRHIDELNSIIQAQKRQASGAAANTAQPSSQPYHTTTFHPPHTPQAPAHLQQSSIKPEPFTTFFHPTPPHPVKPKAPVPSKPVLSAIVFEFTEASGTRYLLPKDSILEYLPGNTQVLMSFLITRKGDMAFGGKHRSSHEYYQPMTVRITADNAKVLEPLARVVNPPDEVRRRISEQMETLELAQDAYLALRLPRSTEESQPAADVPVVPKVEVLKTRYGPPDSLLPILRPIGRVDMT